MANASILLVDDETKILNALANALRGDGYEVVATSCPREAQKLLGQRMFDQRLVPAREQREGIAARLERTNHTALLNHC